MDIHSTFADNMRSYRKAAGLSQEDLAEKTGLHRTYIGGIEQQRVNLSLKNILKIAVALEIEPAILLAQNSGELDEITIKTAMKPYDENPKKVKNFGPGDYALCIWTDDGMKVEPISVRNEDLTMRILCSLASNNIDGEISEVYEQIQDKIYEFFDSIK